MANKYFPNLSDNKDIASVEPIKDGFNKVETDVTELQTDMDNVAGKYATKKSALCNEDGDSSIYTLYYDTTTEVEDGSIIDFHRDETLGEHTTRETVYPRMAVRAKCDKDGNPIESTYATKAEAITEMTELSNSSSTAPVQFVRYDDSIINFRCGDNTALLVSYANMALKDWNNDDIRTTYATKTELADKEDIANKVTSITTDADDGEYPTVKAVKDYTDSSRKYDVIIDYTYNEDETTAKLYIPVTEEQLNKIRRYEKFFSRVSYQVPADTNGATAFWAYTALAICSMSAPTTPVTYPALFMRAAHAGEKRTADNQVWIWMASMEKLALPTTSGNTTYVSKVADYGGSMHKFQNISGYYKLGHSHIESNMFDVAYTSYAWAIEISVPEEMPINKGMRFTLWGK